jgi:putative sugar O-methyltransferase
MKNLILRFGAKVYRALESQKNFASNSLASVNYLNDGLSVREEKVDNPYHKEIIKRIVSSYHLAKADQSKATLPYKPGGAWNEDIERRRAKYLKALNAKDFDGLSDLLRNLFRNNGVAGLWTHGYFGDIHDASNARKKHFINCILEDYNTVIDFVDNFDISNLRIPSVGNPWGYVIKETLVLPTACRHYYYASHVHSLLEDTIIPVVCEIGGGFGGFAYYLLSSNKGAKYINFDLPEVLLIAQYFLMSAFPDKKVLLYGEDGHQDISEEVINKYDIILMPNFALPNVTDRAVDLFINTGSLSEMDYHTVEEYINQIARITKKYFFHDNSDRPSLNTSGHIEVVSSKFPIPHAIFKRVYKSNSLWGGGGGRYREHLYQRKEA